MTGNEQFDDSIGRWLEEAAPDRLPQRVLEAAFERTRRTRQDPAWRAILGRPQTLRSILALGGAAIVVMAAVLAVSVIPLIGGSVASPSPSATASPSTSMWPQSTLEEVQAAQGLADAGDPFYTWQVVPDLGIQLGQHHPGNGDAFFGRFLEEKLGWEKYQWDEASAHPDGLGSGDVVYVRCAASGTKPLYPDDRDGPGGCAPTLDELRYETVKINAAQLDRQGPRGIWVVTGWDMIDPFEQVAPPSDAEISASLGAFLQARIGGQGAERFADFAESDQLADERVGRAIPLLYATSTGARYERPEFKLVEGPVWPSGGLQFEVRLFAQNGATVVKQLFSLHRDGSGRLRVVYDFQPTVSSDRVPATTENGKAVPVEYGFLDGEVTYRAAYPLEPSTDGYRAGDRLAIDGLLPDDDAPRRILRMLADPRPLGSGCAEAPAPVDAEALARSIRSDPDFDATAPVAVTIGGTSALQMDVSRAPTSSCGRFLEPSPGGPRVRLYLVDLPGGSARVLVIAIAADEDSFETVLKWAAPIVDSIEFHAP